MNTPIQRSLLLDTVLDAYHEVGVAADNLTIYAKVARVIGINMQDYVAKIDELNPAETLTIAPYATRNKH